MGTTYHNKPIVTDGLVFCVDPANKVSWTGPNSSNVNDLMGNNDGTIYNDTSGSYGTNTSFDFDGTDDTIDVGNISSLNGATQATWSAWVKKSSNGAYYLMGAWGKPQSTSTRQFLPYNFSTYLMAVYMGNSAGTSKTMFQNNSLSISHSVWYNWVFVYNESESSNSDKLKFYFDGTLIANEVAGAALTSINSVTTSFEIGGATDGQKWNGNIGPVHIYNRALSASEVTQNYNALKNRFI